MDKSVKNIWESYLKSIGEKPETTSLTFESWSFETSEEASNCLADLVKKGNKRATSSTFDNFQQVGEVVPEVGDLHIITNWDGKAQFIIKTTGVNIVPYRDVTEEFAKKEGEGDLSLTYWQEIHRPIFIMEQEKCGKVFSEDTKIVCEEFELIYYENKN